MIIQRWRDTYARITVRNYRYALRALLRNIEQVRGATGLANELARTPAPYSRTTIATAEQIHALLTKAEPWFRCFLLLCADLGLRSGTACRVAPQHYFPEEGVLRILTKNDQPIEMPVSPELRKLFELAPPGNPTTPFWKTLRNPDHPEASREVLTYRWLRLKKKCGIPEDIHFHDLRRTVAVRTLNQTNDIRTVSTVLGHTNLRSTFAYIEHRDTTAIRKQLEQLWWTPRGRGK